MQPVYLDIEVIPNLSDDQIDEFAATIGPPTNYKKPEAIQKWKAENADDILHEKIAKACFNELTGRIICIGTCIGDGAVKVLSGAEVDVITDFFEFLYQATETNNRFPTLVGHNAIAFDIPYIWRRSKALGLDAPFMYPTPSKLKPWSESIDDTMVMWCGNKGYVSLDNLAIGLGLESHKDAIDGSMVWPLWKEGKEQEIYDYCTKDVELTRKIHTILK